MKIQINKESASITDNGACVAMQMQPVEQENDSRPHAGHILTQGIVCGARSSAPLTVSSPRSVDTLPSQEAGSSCGNDIQHKVLGVHKIQNNAQWTLKARSKNVDYEHQPKKSVAELLRMFESGEVLKSYSSSPDLRMPAAVSEAAAAVVENKIEAESATIAHEDMAEQSDKPQKVRTSKPKKLSLTASRIKRERPCCEAVRVARTEAARELQMTQTAASTLPRRRKPSDVSLLYGVRPGSVKTPDTCSESASQATQEKTKLSGVKNTRSISVKKADTLDRHGSTRMSSAMPANRRTCPNADATRESRKVSSSLKTGPCAAVPSAQNKKTEPRSAVVRKTREEAIRSSEKTNVSREPRALAQERAQTSKTYVASSSQNHRKAKKCHDTTSSTTLAGHNVKKSEKDAHIQKRVESVCASSNLGSNLQDRNEVRNIVREGRAFSYGIAAPIGSWDRVSCALCAVEYRHAAPSDNVAHSTALNPLTEVRGTPSSQRPSTVIDVSCTSAASRDVSASRTL